MIAEHQDDAGTDDEPGKRDRPSHTAAIILGAIGTVVAVPTAVVNIIFWTDGHGREVHDMLNMQLTAVAVGCLIGTVAAWWGSNIVHRLKHVEAVEQRIEAREEIMRAEFDQKLTDMQNNILRALGDLGEKVAKAKQQSYWHGCSDTVRDLKSQGQFDGKVIDMPGRGDRGRVG